MKNLVISVLTVLIVFFNLGLIAQKTTFTASKGVLYSVDDKYGDNYIFFYSNAYKKATVKLDPGSHTFVFTTWKDVYQFTIDMKPDATYNLSKGKPLTLKENGKKMKQVEFKKVSVENKNGVSRLTNETDDSKVAILTFSKEQYQKEGSIGGPKHFRLRRIDDYWGPSRLGFHNGLNGTFTIYLEPGKHTLVAEVSGGSGISSPRKIKEITHEFEAGKEYTVDLVGYFMKVVAL
jgi:hypothetical protein